MSSKGQHGRSPNARLQDRILLYLGHHDDVETVVGLARTLESPRSSTSRAINRLKTDGLVQKVDYRWALTDEGKAEETRLRSGLRERSERANMEIERIVKRQEEFDRTVGFSAAKAVDSSLKSIHETARIPAISALESIHRPGRFPALSAAEELTKAARVPMTSVVEHLTATLRAPMTSAAENLAKAATAPMTSVAQNLAKYAIFPVPSAVVGLNYQVRPFVETMRLVDTVGIGNVAISSRMKSISDSVLANQSSYMASIAKAALASSFAPPKLESLFDNLNLIDRRIGETAFASLQVRAVEDLMKRISSSAIPSDAFKAFEDQMDLAAGAMVRQMLEQAEVDDLLDETLVGEVDSKMPASDALEDMPSTLPSDARSELFYNTWNELSEQVKLRYVAVATFLILHVCLLAAQHQPNNYEYVMGRIHALEGAVAAVVLCQALGLFKDEE